MQEELEKIWLYNKTTMIMVTHDIEEAGTRDVYLYSKFIPEFTYYHLVSIYAK